MKKLVSLI